MSGRYVSIFAGRATKELGTKIAEAYGTQLGKSQVVVFSDGEFQPSFEESIRGHHVFIVQSTMPSTDNLMELLLMIDAAKRASAHKVIAVIPYFGWARQDRKDQPRVSIGSKLVANMLTAAHVDRIITMDLHADQIQGFFDIPMDALYASSIFIDHIQKMNIDNLLIAAPDLGASKRASAYAKRLGCDLAVCHKQRARANVVESMTLIGDVKDKNVIILDDIIDTAGTIVKAGQVMMDNGAKSVRAFATHAVCSVQRSGSHRHHPAARQCLQENPCGQLRTFVCRCYPPRGILRIHQFVIQIMQNPVETRRATSLQQQ